MKTVGQGILAFAVVLAVFAGGCGSDSCPSESPKVEAVANCSAPAGAQVSYQLRLCPTCNQNLTGCTVDMSAATTAGGTIFLNPVVEACESASSCPPATCFVNPTCAVTVPAGAASSASWTVEVFDGVSSTKTGTLTVGPTSCQFT
jgi:hypothetical protein